MAVYKKKKIIFIHVIKTGGTAIDKMMKNERDFSFFSNRNKHMTALDYKNKMGKKYDDYYKFAVVRNPWDWVVSWYEFVQKSTISPDNGKVWRHALYQEIAGKSFDSYVDWLVEDKGMKNLPSRKKSVWKYKYKVEQSDWLVDNEGKLIVDEIVKFEEINEFAERLNKKFSLGSKLEVVNKIDRKNYKSYYSEKTKKKIFEYFKNDIKKFKYEF